MQSLPTITVNKIKILRKEGYSYKSIGKKLQTSVGLVYKYAHNVLLSQEAKRRLELNVMKNQERFAKLHKRKEIKIPRIETEEFIRVLGHCFFDGSVNKDGVRYFNVSDALIGQFKNDMKTAFNLLPSNQTIRQKVHFVKTIYYNNRNLSDFLFSLTPSYSTSSIQATLPSFIFSLDNDLICEFLKTFWEDEGCIKRTGVIRGKTKSRRIAKQLIELHKKIEIQASLLRDSTNDAYDINIKLNRENIRKFATLIGFRHSVICRGFYSGFKKSEILNMLHNSKLSTPP